MREPLRRNDKGKSSTLFYCIMLGGIHEQKNRFIMEYKVKYYRLPFPRPTIMDYEDDEETYRELVTERIGVLIQAVTSIVKEGNQYMPISFAHIIDEETSEIKVVPIQNVTIIK